MTALALATMLFGGSSLFAQNLVNSGTVRIYTGASVVFTENTGEFENDAVIGNITNDGKIVFQGTTNTFTGTNPLGADDANRVPGTVEYNGAGNSQAVQDNRYFTNLIVNNTGGTIVFPAGANTWLSGTYTLTAGARTFNNNTFYFDGDTGEDQALDFTETFNNLVFSQAGAKSITNTGAVTVAGTFDIAASATADTDILGTLALGGVATVNAAAGEFRIGAVADAGTVTIGTGNATFNNIAGVEVVEGMLDVNDTGELIIADGVTLNLASVDGVLRVGDGSTLRITGALTNQVAANTATRVNFDFHCSSIEIYDGTAAQIVASTDNIVGNKYGILNLLNSTKTLENNIYLCNELTVTDAIVDAYGTGPLQDYDVVMTTASDINFTNPDDEIRGVVRREHTLAAATPYTFNNQGTIVTFTDVTAPGGFFEVSSVSGLNPYNYDPLTGITRRILMDFDGTNMEWTTSVGFNDSDIPVTNTFPVSTVRFYEGDNSPAKEKMSTGSPYTRTDGTAPALNIVSLPGFKVAAGALDGTADAEFLATNELTITFGPSVFTSIASGRWSNPATWDEGTQPGPDDETLIKHTVHIGYVRAGIDNFGPATSMTGANSEGIYLTNYPGYGYTAGNPMELASKITIDDVLGASLLVGEGTDGAVTYAVRDGVAGITNSGFIFNNNSGNGTEEILTASQNLGVIGTTLYDGFYILNSATQMNAVQFENAGFVGTYGLLNIGN